LATDQYPLAFCRRERKREADAHFRLSQADRGKRRRPAQRRGTRMPSRTGRNCGQSCRCPAVTGSVNGFCPCSTARCSLWSACLASARGRGRRARCRHHQRLLLLRLFTSSGGMPVSLGASGVHTDIPGDQALRGSLGLQQPRSASRCCPAASAGTSHRTDPTARIAPARPATAYRSWSATVCRRSTTAVSTATAALSQRQQRQVEPTGRPSDLHARRRVIIHDLSPLSQQVLVPHQATLVPSY
jgi:hypothetical protein